MKKGGEQIHQVLMHFILVVVLFIFQSLLLLFPYSHLNT